MNAHETLGSVRTGTPKALAVLGALLLTACPAPSPGEPDAATASTDAFVPVGDDAGNDDAAMVPDAYTCPRPSAGRWVIGPFTYAGPDCTPRSSIDLEYHAVAFTVDASGNVASCECDTPTDTCVVSQGTAAPPDCSVVLDCHGGSTIRIIVRSPTSAEVVDHDLSCCAGTCRGSGPFTLQ